MWEDPYFEIPASLRATVESPEPNEHAHAEAYEREEEASRREESVREVSSLRRGESVTLRSSDPPPTHSLPFLHPEDLPFPEFRFDRPNFGVRGILEDYASARLALREDFSRDAESVTQLVLDTCGIRVRSVEELESLPAEMLDAVLTERISRRIASRLDSNQTSSKLSTRGFVREANKVTLLDEIEDPQYPLLVLLLYQSSIPECRIVSDLLEDIAETYDDIKFLQIKANAAMEGFPDVALPGFLVYRNGELDATILRIQDEVSSLTVESLTDLLETNGVFRGR